jgi:hypothetical protein
MGLVFLAGGLLWLVVPRFYTRGLPSDDAEVWSYPRGNTIAMIFRLIRWTNARLWRRVAWGALEMATGAYLLWGAFGRLVGLRLAP